MQSSIHRYFQVGTLQWMSFPSLSVLNALRQIAADDFFDAVEVAPIADAQLRRQAAHILRHAHMRVCYGAHPMQLSTGLNPNAIDEAERLAAQTRLMEAIDEAAELGASGFAFMAGKWHGDTKERALRNLVETTVNLCAYAAKKGILVELEVFDYDMDKAVLIGPAPLARRFAEEVRSQCANFGLLVDLSHIPTTHETSRFVIQTLRPYLTHVHIGNAVVRPGCEGYGDQHPRFGFPNSENDAAELTDFLRVLRDEGFFREEAPMVLSFEVKPRPDEDADLVLAGSKRTLNRAWAILEEKA